MRIKGRVRTQIIKSKHCREYKWNQLDFKDSYLRKSNLLNYLENNDSIFSWKAKVLKDKKQFWKNGGFHKVFKKDQLYGSEWNEGMDMNLVNQLQKKNISKKEIKNIQNRIFNQKWTMKDEIMSRNTHTMKDITEIIKDNTVMVFDLKISNLKVVEKFMIALRNMEEDGVQRKLIMISDLMTWAEQGEQTEPVLDTADTFTSFNKLLKQVKNVQVVNKLGEESGKPKKVMSLGKQPVTNVNDSEDSSVITKANDFKKKYGTDNIKIEISTDNSKKTFDLQNSTSVRETRFNTEWMDTSDWKTNIMQDFEKILNENKSELARELEIKGILGRTKKQYVRSFQEEICDQKMKEGLAKRKTWPYDSTLECSLPVRTLEYLKESVFCSANQQNFGLQLEDRLNLVKDKYQWNDYRNVESIF